MSKIYNENNSTPIRKGFLEIVGVKNPLNKSDNLTYEVVNKQDAVVGLVLTHDLKSMYVTQQYRPCDNKLELGLVAGICDKEKSNEAILIEEIEEEIRIPRKYIKSIEHMGIGFSSSGMTTEAVHRYLVILSEEAKFDDTLTKAEDTDKIIKGIIPFNYETYSKMTSNTSQLLMSESYQALFNKSIFPKKRIAVYGGCFSPFTIQHLNIIIKAIETLKLDKVIIMPCSDFISKKKVPYKLRKEIILESLKGLPKRLRDKIEVSDLENVRFEMTTYETLSKIRDIYKFNTEIFSILGSDNIEEMDKKNWKHREELLKNFNVIAVERAGFEMNRIFMECSFISKNYRHIFTIPPVNQNTVSSTIVRDKLFNRAEIYGLVCHNAIEIIENNIELFISSYKK